MCCQEDNQLPWGRPGASLPACWRTTAVEGGHEGLTCRTCGGGFKGFLFWLRYLHSAAASFTSVLPLRARKSGQAQQLRRLAGEHCGCVVLLRC